jgi:hypothetical protein
MAGRRVLANSGQSLLPLFLTPLSTIQRNVVRDLPGFEVGLANAHQKTIKQGKVRRLAEDATGANSVLSAFSDIQAALISNEI